MSIAREFRIAPATTRRRGLPPIGLSVFAPDCLDVTVIETGASALLCASEADSAGKKIGVVEIDIFTANMIIDPDGALERAAEEALAKVLCAPAAGTVRHRERFELDDGTSGVRLEVLMTRDADGAPSALPHLTVVALAPDDAAARGGLVTMVRSARPSWAAADTLFETLRVITRDNGGANDNVRAKLPFAT
jgi:hypothetical protein